MDIDGLEGRTRTGDITGLMVLVYGDSAIVACHICDTDLAAARNVVIVICIMAPRYRKVRTSVVGLAHWALNNWSTNVC